jgi:hypothetical protein
MVEFLSVIEYDVGSNPIVLVSSTDISFPIQSLLALWVNLSRLIIMINTQFNLF